MMGTQEEKLEVCCNHCHDGSRVNLIKGDPTALMPM